MGNTQISWELTHDEGGLVAPVLRNKDGQIIADTRRILACLHACEIVSTEDLERYYNTGRSIDEALEEAGLQDHLKAVQAVNRLQTTLGQIADVLALEDHERCAEKILAALMRLKVSKPSLAIPEALELDVFSNSHDEGYVNGFNACRAELLANQTAQEHKA